MVEPKDNDSYGGDHTTAPVLSEKAKKRVVFKESVEKNRSPSPEGEQTLRRSPTKILSAVDLQNAMKSGIQGIMKDKKKEFYFRGHLKQHNIDLNKHDIDVKKATNYFDDDEEIRNAKIMVKNIMRPSKKKFSVEINQKVFGMTPVQY